MSNLAYYKSRNTETRNDEIRNTRGTTEQRRNNGTAVRRTPGGQPEHHETTTEYRNNGTRQKLEPEDKLAFFITLHFMLERKVNSAMDR